MGKKGKRSRKAQAKTSGLFTLDERNKKVAKIYMQVMMENMFHVIRPELRSQVQNYINTGEQVEYDLELPAYSRTLQVRLYNRKDKDSFICFKYNRVTVEDGDKDSHPLNAQREKLETTPLDQIEDKSNVDDKTKEDSEEFDEAELEKEAMKELEEEIAKELEEKAVNKK